MLIGDNVESLFDKVTINLICNFVINNKKTNTLSLGLEYMNRSDLEYIGVYHAMSDNVIYRIVAPSHINPILNDKITKVIIQLPTEMQKWRYNHHIKSMRPYIRLKIGHSGYSLFKLGDIGSNIPYYGNHVMISHITDMRNVCINLHLYPDIANLVVDYCNSWYGI